MKFITPDWPAPANIRSLVTQKQPYWQNEDRNINPSQLVDDYRLPAKPRFLKQTHSAIAHHFNAISKVAEGDAVYSDTKNTICAILTADCLPILLCDRAGKHVAAIHAGWRGLAKGIIQATVNALPVAANELYAWLGPAISQTHFEVGVDVYEAFTTLDKSNAIFFEKTGDRKWHANLYGLARHVLQKLGLNEIYGGKYCTYRDESLFYSYRRDNGQTGRIVSMIWISD